MASKRNIRRRSCESKIKYSTSDDATRAMHSLRRDFNYKNGHIYACSFCGGWHVGRKTQTMIIAARAKKRNREFD